MDWSTVKSFDDALIGKKIIVNASGYLASFCRDGLKSEICRKVGKIKGRKGSKSFSVANKVISISVPKDTGPYPTKAQFEDSL